MNVRIAIALASLTLSCAPRSTPSPRSPDSQGGQGERAPICTLRSTPLSDAEFRTLMQTIADGWNEGNSRKSAQCFAERAIYMEPPDAQVYEGRETLFEMFGGKDQPPQPGRMTLHHVLFDEARQIGAAEYTYQGRKRLHGMLIVRVAAGTISHWREYQYPSTLDWSDFAGKSKF